MPNPLGETLRIKTAPPLRRPWRRTYLLVLTLGWNFGCLLLSHAYQGLVAPRVVTIWPILFGNLQATFSIYARVSFWLASCLITAPPLLLGLWWCRRQSPPETFGIPLPIAFAAWEVAVVLIWGLAYEFGLHRAINRLDWSLFGPPDLYSFRNLALPLFIAWVVTTTPVVLAAFARNLPATDRRDT